MRSNTSVTIAKRFRVHPYTFSPVRYGTFFTNIVNRVEHKNRNQPAIESGRLLSFLVFKSAFGRHRHLLIPRRIKRKRRRTSAFYFFAMLLGCNKCLRLPETKLNTKKETKRQLFNGRLVSYMVFK